MYWELLFKMKKLYLIIFICITLNNYCQTVIVVNPKKPNYVGDALTNLGNIAFRDRQLKQENAEFEQQQYDKEREENKQHEEFIKSELKQFDLRIVEKNYPEALIEINKFINGKSGDDLIRGYYHRGEIRFALEDYVGSIADCNKCIALTPKEFCTLPYCLRGKAKEELDDLKGALLDYDESINIEKNMDAFFNRGLLKIKLKKNGCSDLKKAEKLGHDNAYEMIKKYCN